MPRSKSTEGLRKLTVRPSEAAWMLSIEESKFASLCEQYNVKPVKQGHRLTLYDVRDVERLRDLMRAEAGLAPVA